MQNRIKEQRTRMKVSQDELAKMTGVTRQTINAIENAKYDPSLALAFKLAHVLGLDLEELFIWTEGRYD